MQHVLSWAGTVGGAWPDCSLVACRKRLRASLHVSLSWFHKLVVVNPASAQQKGTL